MKSRCLSFFILLLIGLNTVAHAYEVDFEKDKSLPLVYLNVAIKKGSVSDPKNKSGLTYFMGEMLLRGTKTKTKEQIDLALDQMGAQLSVEGRAEALIFRGAVLSSQLEPFLKLWTEILTKPSFPESEIAKLKSEMISNIEEELGQDPSLASRKFSEFLFRDHPYGRPVIGKTSSIRNLTRSEMVAQYNRLVRDPFILVLGSGNATEDRISSWAKELATARAQLPTPNKEPDTLIADEVNSPEDGASRRLLIVDKPDRTQTQIHFGQIGVQMTDEDYLPLSLGNYAFGGGSFSATMMLEIRVKRGWSYGANSSFRFGLRPRSWIGHVFPASKDTADALALSLSLVKDLQEKGLTQEQFDFAKRSLVNSSGFMYNTPRKRVENKLLEKTLHLPDGFIKSYGSEIKGLKLKQVNAALKKFLKPEKLAISVLCTSDTLKDALIKAAGVSPEQVKVIPYTQE